MEKLLELAERVEVPDVNPLHDQADPSRVNSTYVAQRLANEPRQGPPTNTQATPQHVSGSSGGSGKKGFDKFNSPPAAHNASLGLNGNYSSSHNGNTASTASALSGGGGLGLGLGLEPITSHKAKSLPAVNNNPSGFSGMLSNLGNNNNDFFGGNNNAIKNTGNAGFGSMNSMVMNSNKPLGLGANKGFPSNNSYGQKQNALPSISNSNTNQQISHSNSNNVPAIAPGFGGQPAGDKSSRFGRLAQFGMGMMGPGGNNNGSNAPGNSGVTLSSASAPVGGNSGNAMGFGGRHKF